MVIEGSMRRLGSLMGVSTLSRGYTFTDSLRVTILENISFKGLDLIMFVS